MNRPSGLGRGLAALIPTAPAPDDPSGTTVREVPIDEVGRNPRQPRAVFDHDELAELAASITTLGLLQPIVVRETEDGWQLIAGERRLRAARMAGLATIPAIVRPTADDDLLTEALVENIHRVQLNPIEEASAYAQLLDDFGVSKKELARRLGRSRPTISNLVRLLTLPTDIQQRVAAGVLTAGHAKALVAVPEANDQRRLADRIVREQLSVRAAEELASLSSGGEASRSADTPRRPDADTDRTSALEVPGLEELEDTLSEALHAPVRIRVGARSGRMTITFTSADELDHVVGIISSGLAASLATI